MPTWRALFESHTAIVASEPAWRGLAAVRHQLPTLVLNPYGAVAFLYLHEKCASENVVDHDVIETNVLTISD